MNQYLIKIIKNGKLYDEVEFQATNEEEFDDNMERIFVKYKCKEATYFYSEAEIIGDFGKYTITYIVKRYHEERRKWKWKKLYLLDKELMKEQ